MALLRLTSGINADSAMRVTNINWDAIQEHSVHTRLFSGFTVLVLQRNVHGVEAGGPLHFSRSTATVLVLQRNVHGVEAGGPLHFSRSTATVLVLQRNVYGVEDRKSVV